jgi:hypothetical protein
VRLEQREVVLFGVVLDEALHHPGPGRAVAQHRVGDDAPPQRLRKLVRGDLAQRECAPREVPERAFAALRFVHREQVAAFA